jgi:hypothetical protein
MDRSREEFLEQFGGDYGYPDAPRGVDQMRAADFKRLQGANPFTLLSVYSYKRVSEGKTGFFLGLLSPVESMVLELRMMAIGQLNQCAGACGGSS